MSRRSTATLERPAPAGALTPSPLPDCPHGHGPLMLVERAPDEDQTVYVARVRCTLLECPLVVELFQTDVTALAALRAGGAPPAALINFLIERLASRQEAANDFECFHEERVTLFFDRWVALLDQAAAMHVQWVTECAH